MYKVKVNSAVCRDGSVNRFPIRSDMCEYRAYASGRVKRFVSRFLLFFGRTVEKVRNSLEVARARAIDHDRPRHFGELNSVTQRPETYISVSRTNTKLFLPVLQDGKKLVFGIDIFRR